MTFTERLWEALDASDMTEREFRAKMVGLGMTRANLTYWFNGRAKDPSASWVDRAAELLKVSTAWLAAGRGPRSVGSAGSTAISARSPDERILLELFSGMADDARGQLIAYASGLYRARPARIKPAYPDAESLLDKLADDRRRAHNNQTLREAKHVHVQDAVRQAAGANGDQSSAAARSRKTPPAARKGRSPKTR